MHAETRHFFLLFQYLKNYIFKKNDEHGFLSYIKHYLSTKNSQQTMMLTWVGAGQKFDFFVQKSWFFCNSKHFLQKIMTPCYSCYFCIFYIFNCFQIIMVSLFFAFHDQYFMFKSSNIFEATNFPFKTKYNVTVVYSINRNCLFSRGKLEKKLLKQFFDTLYLLMFRQNSMIFEGSPNSLTKSYFPGESRLGET